jgi:coiled-coil domain-containing protein 130
MPRLESLQSVSEQYNSDPYALSLKVRKRFRTEKKVRKEKQAVDDLIKDRYGLPETLCLVEDDDDVKLEAREEWQKGRRELEMGDYPKRRRLSLGTASVSTSPNVLPRPMPSSQSRRNPSNDAVTSLRARILKNTSRKRTILAGE